jgi:hypothetical protein
VRRIIRTDIYRITPFPEPGFNCDEPAQSNTRQLAKRKDRALMALFGGMAVSFALGVLVGIMHFFVALMLFLALFALSFLGLLFTLLKPLPGNACQKCGNKLETAWHTARGGVAAEFRVCRRCRLYRYMFRTGRN